MGFWGVFGGVLPTFGVHRCPHDQKHGKIPAAVAGPRLGGSCCYLPPSLSKSRYQSVDSAARPTDPFTVNCQRLNEANDCHRLDEEANARCVAGEGGACPGTDGEPSQDERGAAARSVGQEGFGSLGEDARAGATARVVEPLDEDDRHPGADRVRLLLERVLERLPLPRSVGQEGFAPPEDARAADRGGWAGALAGLLASGRKRPAAGARRHPAWWRRPAPPPGQRGSPAVLLATGRKWPRRPRGVRWRLGQRRRPTSPVGGMAEWDEIELDVDALRSMAQASRGKPLNTHADGVRMKTCS